MADKKSNTIINTIILTVISVIAVALLAIVNQITAEPIAQAEVNQKAQVYKVVYSDCDSFSEIENAEQMIADSDALLNEKGLGGCKIIDVLAANDATGKTEGYIVAASSNAGYGGEIQIAIGIKDGKLTGFSSISNSETAGLGSKCSEPEFTEQFKGKSASLLTFTKSGASSETEIDAISGATITTNAVTQAVNAAILFYQENFGGGAQEIAKADLTEFYKKAYPGGEEFSDVENAKDLIANSSALLEEYSLTDCTIEEIKAVNGGEGYVISTTATGFAKTSPFQIAIGIKDGKLTGFAVVSSMESPGYGAKMEEDAFTSQFAGKTANVLTQEVGGTADNEIDAIAGATITSSAIARAVNAGIVFYQSNFGDASQLDKQTLASSSADATSGATAPAQGGQQNQNQNQQGKE